jgi:serine/threonine protein kinase/Flp pilus assembly protein TadD
VTPRTPADVPSIFGRALEIESPVDRAAYLDEACGHDASLRAEVDGLLGALTRAGEFMRRPVTAAAARLAATVDEQPVTERPGTVIGPYKLLEQIGEGGFGVVFMAEQQQPLRRKVALKVIKPGMDSKQVIARFEAEQQALALMDHPHIAHVLDAGTTDAGRPYFVMELIRGIPITGFCDDNRLTPRERLELFLAVCQAVQHAHQKGIIHRDLKPSNVLVTLLDGTPTVKVIDFGIAKALGHERLTERTLCTGFAQMVGTPLYMSPEQAELSGHDVDTRTDIYSLGVLLYELLTGTTPFDKERLKEASYDEIRRIIREEEPVKPSTRISTLGQAATTVSANRKSEPKRLSQLFRRELDWIVMKALEKDRNRRYDTASAFAADVQCYLDDEPVQACPPTLARRAAKWGRRHKTLMWAAMLLLVVATIGSGVSTFLIMQERDVAQANSHRAEQILDTAYRSLDKMYLAWAEKRLPEAKEVTPEDRQFLEDTLAFYVEFANQNSSAPTGRQKTAGAYVRVATIQAQLGQDAEAKRNYRHALEALRQLAAVYPNNADYRCSLARCLSGMADWTLHPIYFETREDNEEAFREAIQLQEKLVAEHPMRTDYQHDLAESYSALGDYIHGSRRYDEAEKLFRSACTIFARLAEENPTVMAYRKDLCDVLGRLGCVIKNSGRLQEAGEILCGSLERRKKLLRDFPGFPGPRDCLGWGYQNLAEWQGAAGRLHDAAESYLRALDIRTKLASDFPTAPKYRANLGKSYCNRASVLSQLRRLHEAEQAYRAALAIYQALARDYPAFDYPAYNGGWAQAHLGRLARERGEPEAALAWFDQAIATLSNKVWTKETQHDARNLLTIACGHRAVALVGLRRLKEAEQAFKGLEETYREDLSHDPTDPKNWICNALLRLQLSDLEGYHSVCREMLARFRRSDDASIAALTAETWLLVPAPTADLEPILRLAERAITGTEQDFNYCWFLLIKGMADYRAGQLNNAVDRLTQVLSLSREDRYLNTRPLSATTHALLAMTYHRLGRAALARQSFQQATELLEEPYPKIGWSWNVEQAWHNWLILHSVHQEAEALVRAEDEPLK